MGVVSLGLWSDVVECLGKVDAKMGTRCTQDGPSRRPRRDFELLGWFWEPRRLQIRKNGSKILGWCSPRAALDTNLLLKTVQELLGLDFGGVRARFSMIFR